MKPSAMRNIVCLPAPFADHPVSAAKTRAENADSAREHAQFLHRQCGVSFDEACNRAGYDPLGNEHDQAAAFVCIVAGICLLICAVVLA